MLWLFFFVLVVAYPQYSASSSQYPLDLESPWEIYDQTQNATYTISFNGFCTLSGIVQVAAGSPSPALGTIIANLPTTCRPTLSSIFSQTSEMWIGLRIDVKANGTVQVSNWRPNNDLVPNPGDFGTWVSLDGISFRMRSRIVLESDTPLSRQGADSTCISLGGHLSTIHDSIENTELLQQLNATGFAAAYIGINDIQQEATYEWADGQSSYTNWELGPPNNDGSDCVVLEDDGFWVDVSCGDVLPYFCTLLPPGTSEGHFTYELGWSNFPEGWEEGTWTLSGGVCTLTGVIAMDAPPPQGSTITILPDQCHPQHNLIFTQIATTANVIRVDVLSDGAVYISDEAPNANANFTPNANATQTFWVSLNGIEFSIGSGVQEGLSAVPALTSYDGCPRIYFQDGRCFLSGSLEPVQPVSTLGSVLGFGGNDGIIGQVPSYCLPENDLSFNRMFNQRNLEIRVYSDGRIVMPAGSPNSLFMGLSDSIDWLALSGMSWQRAGCAEFEFNCFDGAPECCRDLNWECPSAGVSGCPSNNETVHCAGENPPCFGGIIECWTDGMWRCTCHPSSPCRHNADGQCLAPVSDDCYAGTTRTACEFPSMTPTQAPTDFPTPSPTGLPTAPPAPDLIITTIERTTLYYLVNYCNVGDVGDVGNTNDTFAVEITSTYANMTFQTDSTMSVPDPGQCLQTGGITCGLIGDTNCDANLCVSAHIDVNHEITEGNENNNQNQTCYDLCFWRQTAECYAAGAREPQFDEPCNVLIQDTASGYCECQDGSHIDFNCGHNDMTCFDACNTVPPRIFIESTSTWLEAKDDCLSRGMHLHSVHSLFENTNVAARDLFGVFRTPIWIGLNDRDEEGVFLWEDGSVVDYTNWQAGEPHGEPDSGAQLDCVAIDGEGWTDENCDGLGYSYFCSGPRRTAAPTSPPPTPAPTHPPTLAPTHPPTLAPVPSPSPSPSPPESPYHTTADSCLEDDSVPTCTSNFDSAAKAPCCSQDGQSCDSSPNGDCSGTVTYLDAVKFCGDYMMRLCTTTELSDGLCCNSGCNYDAERAWTSIGCPQATDCEEIAGFTLMAYKGDPGGGCFVMSFSECENSCKIDDACVAFDRNYITGNCCTWETAPIGKDDHSTLCTYFRVDPETYEDCTDCLNNGFTWQKEICTDDCGIIRAPCIEQVDFCDCIGVWTIENVGDSYTSIDWERIFVMGDECDEFAWAIADAELVGRLTDDTVDLQINAQWQNCRSNDNTSDVYYLRNHRGKRVAVGGCTDQNITLQDTMYQCSVPFSLNSAADCNNASCPVDTSQVTSLSVGAYDVVLMDGAMSPHSVSDWGVSIGIEVDGHLVQFIENIDSSTEQDAKVKYNGEIVARIAVVIPDSRVCVFVIDGGDCSNNRGTQLYALVKQEQYQLFEHMTYLADYPNILTWNLAELRSSSTFGGNLASIHFPIIEELLTWGLEVSTIWIGLSSSTADGAFQWVDGTELDYGLPFVGAPMGDSCVGLLSNASWEIKNCSSKYSVASQYPLQFKFYEISLSWHAAEDRCVTAGGHLASIPSEIFVDFLMSLCPAGAQPLYWIGLNDLARASRFDWVDKTAYGFEHWGNGEPNQIPPVPDAQHCVLMDPETGDWEVADCTDENPFICAIEIDYHLSNTTATYDDAQYICGSDFKGGHLPTIDSASTNALLAAHIEDQKAVWIGLNDQDTNSLRWDDGSSVVKFPECISQDLDWIASPDPCNVTNTHLSFPNPNPGIQGSCWSHPVGHLDTTDCQDQMVMFIPHDASNQGIFDHKINIYGGDHVDKLIVIVGSNQNSYWHLSDQIADVTNFSNPIIERYWTFVYNSKSRTLEFYIDTNLIAAWSKSLYLGDSDILTFSGGVADQAIWEIVFVQDCVSRLQKLQAFRIPRWMAPDQTPGMNCVALISSGIWVTRDCSIEALEFICAAPRCLQQGCSDCHLPGIHYRIHKDPLTWYEAKAACEADGGILARPYSAEINEHLISISFSWGTELMDFWVGVADLVPGIAAFSYVTGETLDFGYWDVGEPQNQDLDFDVCVEMQTTSTMRWAVKQCNITSGYICEIHDNYFTIFNNTNLNEHSDLCSMELYSEIPVFFESYLGCQALCENSMECIAWSYQLQNNSHANYHRCWRIASRNEPCYLVSEQGFISGIRLDLMTTYAPTGSPTFEPSQVPTLNPTTNPTTNPSTNPSMSPTLPPTAVQTAEPTAEATMEPTTYPTTVPTNEPTMEPSAVPSYEPTSSPEDAESESEEEEEGLMIVVIEGELIDECMFDGESIIVVMTEGRGRNEGVGNVDCDEIKNDKNITESLEDANNNFPTSTCSMKSDINFAINISSLSNEVASCFPVPAAQQGGSNAEVVSAIVEIVFSSDNGQEPENYVFVIPYNPAVECTNDIDNMDSLSCRWFDPEKDDWSMEGCEMSGDEVELQDGLVGVTCKCTHLTAFAIIQDTLRAEDQCKASHILGNTLWIVSVVLYIILLCCTIYNLGRMFFSSVQGQYEVKMIRIKINVLLFAIAILNISLGLMLYTSTNYSSGLLQVLSIFWASLFVFSYWAYTLVVATWASVIHPASNLIKYAFIITGIIMSVLIISMFSAVASSSGNTLREFVFAGSLTIGLLCMILAVGFATYGSLLTFKLHRAGKFLDDPDDKTNFAATARRISVVVSLMSFAFIVQSIILIYSAINGNEFYEQFVAFQAIYLVFDIILLFSMLALHFMGSDKRTAAARTDISDVSDSVERDSIEMGEFHNA